jgi:hypothetical protein
MSELDGKVDGCELCEAARFTPWFHEDDTCWIAECEVCAIPMVVWNRHGTEPPESELEHMLRELTRVGNEVFGDVEFTIDRVMRQIPTHFHAHARDANWWSRRFKV